MHRAYVCDKCAKAVIDPGDGTAWFAVTRPMRIAPSGVVDEEVLAVLCPECAKAKLRTAAHPADAGGEP